MDITKLSVVELKAMVYDEMFKTEMARKNIELLNMEITKRGEALPGVPEVTPEPTA